MRGTLNRIWRVAVTELGLALRCRRALVVVLLFVAVAVVVMYGTISAFAAMEREVLSGLGLPVSDNPGSVTMALWKSRPFARVIGRLVGDSLVFADIQGRHPLLLAYAMFLFQVVSFLTLLVSSSRVAEDLRNGTARYWLVRVTRTEWTLGKFFGEAMMLAFATAVGALAAWTVVVWRLPGWSGVPLLVGILDWSARAWVYAFGWLGLFMGFSHLVGSGGKATALGILALMGAAAWTPMLGNFAEDVPGLVHLDALVPQSVLSQLWRRTPGALVEGLVHLVALSFLYLSLGAAAFRRRDV